MSNRFRSICSGCEAAYVAKGGVALTPAALEDFLARAGVVPDMDVIGRFIEKVSDQISRNKIQAKRAAAAKEEAEERARAQNQLLARFGMNSQQQQRQRKSTRMSVFTPPSNAQQQQRNAQQPSNDSNLLALPPSSSTPVRTNADALLSPSSANNKNSNSPNGSDSRSYAERRFGLSPRPSRVSNNNNGSEKKRGVSSSSTNKSKAKALTLFPPLSSQTYGTGEPFLNASATPPPSLLPPITTSSSPSPSTTVANASTSPSPSLLSPSKLMSLVEVSEATRQQVPLALLTMLASICFLTSTREACGGVGGGMGGGSRSPSPAQRNTSTQHHGQGRRGSESGGASSSSSSSSTAQGAKLLWQLCGGDAQGRGTISFNRLRAHVLGLTGLELGADKVDWLSGEGSKIVTASTDGDGERGGGQPSPAIVVIGGGPGKPKPKMMTLGDILLHGERPATTTTTTGDALPPSPMPPAAQPSSRHPSSAAAFNSTPIPRSPFFKEDGNQGGDNKQANNGEGDQEKGEEEEEERQQFSNTWRAATGNKNNKSMSRASTTSTAAPPPVSDTITFSEIERYFQENASFYRRPTMGQQSFGSDGSTQPLSLSPQAAEKRFRKAKAIMLAAHARGTSTRIVPTDEEIFGGGPATVLWNTTTSQLNNTRSGNNNANSAAAMALLMGEAGDGIDVSSLFIEDFYSPAIAFGAMDSHSGINAYNNNNRRISSPSATPSSSPVLPPSPSTAGQKSSNFSKSSLSNEKEGGIMINPMAYYGGDDDDDDDAAIDGDDVRYRDERGTEAGNSVSSNAGKYRQNSHRGGAAAAPRLLNSSSHHISSSASSSSVEAINMTIAASWDALALMMGEPTSLLAQARDPLDPKAHCLRRAMRAFRGMLTSTHTNTNTVMSGGGAKHEKKNTNTNNSTAALDALQSSVNNPFYAAAAVARAKNSNNTNVSGDASSPKKSSSPSPSSAVTIVVNNNKVGNANGGRGSEKRGSGVFSSASSPTGAASNLLASTASTGFLAKLKSVMSANTNASSNSNNGKSSPAAAAPSASSSSAAASSAVKSFTVSQSLLRSAQRAVADTEQTIEALEKATEASKGQWRERELIAIQNRNLARENAMRTARACGKDLLDADADDNTLLGNSHRRNRRRGRGKNNNNDLSFASSADLCDSPSHSGAFSNKADESDGRGTGGGKGGACDDGNYNDDDDGDDPFVSPLRKRMQKLKALAASRGIALADEGDDTYNAARRTVRKMREEAKRKKERQQKSTIEKKNEDRLNETTAGVASDVAERDENTDTRLLMPSAGGEAYVPSPYLQSNNLKEGKCFVDASTQTDKIKRPKK